jgi:hypothetical protein
VTLLDEWVAKAEGDYKTAVILNRPRKDPQFDSVCYHCQPSAEKYLKAYLIQHASVPRRTHDLEDLLTDRAALDPGLSSLLPLVRFLVPFSVQFRNPGDGATAILAHDALSTLHEFRRKMRRKMGL